MGNAQQKVPTTVVTKPAVNDGPRPTREIIKLTLIGKGAQFEEKARGIFEILTPTREWKTLVTEGNAKQLLIYHIYLQRVPISNAKKTAKVIETISRLNTITVLGNLELDMRDGEIRFKLCASILGLSEKTIEKLLIRLLGISPEQNFQKIRNILDEKDTADNNTPPKVSSEVKSSNEPKPPSVPEIKKGNSDLEKISNSEVKQNVNSPAKQKEQDVKVFL
jgi:hypothetical protein